MALCSGLWTGAGACAIWRLVSGDSVGHDGGHGLGGVMPTQAFFTLLLVVAFLGVRARAMQWADNGASGLCAHAMCSLDVGRVQPRGAQGCAGLAGLCAAGVCGLEQPCAHHSFLATGLPARRLAGNCPAVGHTGIKVAQAVLYLALLAILLAYSLWTRLLQRHTAAKVTPYSLQLPVIGLMAALLVLGEHPAPLQWWGSAAAPCRAVRHGYQPESETDPDDTGWCISALNAIVQRAFAPGISQSRSNCL